MRKKDLIALAITTLIAIIALIATIAYIALLTNNNNQPVDAAIEVLGTVG